MSLQDEQARGCVDRALEGWARGCVDRALEGWAPCTVFVGGERLSGVQDVKYTHQTPQERYETAILVCDDDHQLMNYVLNCALRDPLMLRYNQLCESARRRGFLFSRDWSILREETY